MNDYLKRKVPLGVKSKLDLLLTSQYWEIEKIQHFQWKKLLDVIMVCYQQVPYYRTIFKTLGLLPEDITSFEDYKRVPILKKTDIQGHLENMVAENTDRSELVLNSTGGSTGMPLNFYQDANFREWADAARIRAWRYMAGVGENELEAVFWGAIRDIGAGITVRQTLYNYFRDRTLCLNTFDLDEQMLRRFLQIYNLLKPPLVRGYASSLYYVACYVEKHGLKIHQPRQVISSTEVLHERMRDTIEHVFGCDVLDSYGCREVSQIATECEAHAGLHLVVENQYVEIIDNELIVTNLNNHGMPLLRYKIGDMASRIDSTPCTCGRSSPRIVKLIGRDNDNIQLGEKIINEVYFEFLFFGIQSVVQYQVVYVRSRDELHVKLHLKNDAVDVGDIVKKRIKTDFNFENVIIEYTDSFLKTPTGKLRFVYPID